jgi:hypothetical protein
MLSARSNGTLCYSGCITLLDVIIFFHFLTYVSEMKTFSFRWGLLVLHSSSKSTRFNPNWTCVDFLHTFFFQNKTNRSEPKRRLCGTNRVTQKLWQMMTDATTVFTHATGVPDPLPTSVWQQNGTVIWSLQWVMTFSLHSCMQRAPYVT